MRLRIFIGGRILLTSTQYRLNELSLSVSVLPLLFMSALLSQICLLLPLAKFWSLRLHHEQVVASPSRQLSISHLIAYTMLIAINLSGVVLLTSDWAPPNSYSGSPISDAIPRWSLYIVGQASLLLGATIILFGQTHSTTMELPFAGTAFIVTCAFEWELSRLANDRLAHVIFLTIDGQVTPWTCRVGGFCIGTFLIFVAAHHLGVRASFPDASNGEPPRQGSG